MAKSLSFEELKQFSGRVIEIQPKHKAIVQFTLENKTERALLWYPKLRVNGQPPPIVGRIDNYLKVGTNLKFSCHPFDDSGKDRCQWYITFAWIVDEREEILKKYETISSGLYNCTGQLVQVNLRQGVLSYSSEDGEEHVWFLASKVYLSGKRIPAKSNLNSMPGFCAGGMVKFDAVPCDPTDNENNCKWFATVVWKGVKPLMKYDTPCNEHPLMAKQFPNHEEIKQITSNPTSLFFQGIARVMSIMNSEYGMALIQIKNNKWETMLFHRKDVVLFGHSLEKIDMSQIFKEGDVLRVMAASAPSGLVVRWLASRVRVFIGESVAHMFPS